MEILRFDEVSTSAPKRKKSSKGYLAVGFVATLFGISSAFATNSITINNNAEISLGQGISTFTTCDDKIAVIPATTLNDALTTFGLTQVTIGAPYGDPTSANDYLIDNTLPADGGCNGVDFVVKFYDGTNTPVDVCDDKGLTGVSGATLWKCENQSVVFRVNNTRHDINFNGTAGTDFFDHISIETTAETYPG
jgi:hypothetical protein